MVNESRTKMKIKKLKTTSLLSFVLMCNFLMAQANDGSLKKDISYYLPNIKYNAAITSPEAWLGYQVGEWHVSHDQLVGYLKLLAAESDRVDYTEYGRTHENRPLITLHISSPSNLAKKDQIQQMSADQTDVTKAQADHSQLPLILYQGYTIHGNEASGVNAAVLVAYYLAAGESEMVAATLEKCYILLDPCYNPDGMQRFSAWVNSHRGKNLVTDGASREFNEVWPGGRTNHYWFDLNRDWLLLVQPESRARVKQFHDWKPNVLTDHHEMGTNATFFFQPGVPSRTNALTPAANQELTGLIANYHARALDSIGSLYYSKEGYDDFYYGKGSTYPDIHGAIGILFEQASSRGHLQESANGPLSFPFTIRNQVVTSLSTQKACLTMKEKLHAYKKQFYTDLAGEMAKESTQAYLFSDADVQKCVQMIDLLRAHQIDVYTINRDFDTGGQHYEKGLSYMVPIRQKQGKLIKTLFEKVTTFQDSIFYDVSAWTLPLAYDVKYAALNKEQTLQCSQHATLLSMSPTDAVQSQCEENAVAYAVEWQQAHAPAFLYQLLQKKINVRVLTKPASYSGKGGSVYLGAGSLLIPTGGQNKDKKGLSQIIQALATKNMVNVESIMDGMQQDGLSAGHPSLRNAEQPKVITLVGQGISAYDAGELWHYMDQRLGIATTMVDKKDVGKVNFEKYNTLVLVDGSYSDLQDNAVKKMEDFVKKGGRIIAMGKAIEFLKNKNWIKWNTVEADKPKVQDMPYAQLGEINGARVLAGAIFNATADLSHPLCYGLPDAQLALFKQDTEIFKGTENTFAIPIRYTETSPLLSGYCPKGLEEKIKSSPAAAVFGQGNGTIICFADNLLFRGYWWGGFRVFANALFFGHTIDKASVEKN